MSPRTPRKISEMGGIATQNALYHGRLCSRLAEYDRRPFGLRFCHQVVSGHRDPAGPPNDLFSRFIGQHDSEHGYFFPVILQDFFGKPRMKALPVATTAEQRSHEAPAIMVIPLLLTALASVLMGLYPDYFLNIVKAVDPDYLINIVKAVF